MSQANPKKQGSQRGTKKGGSKTNLNKQPETQQERLARQRQLVDALNRQQIHKYLMNLQPNTQSDLVAGRVVGNSNTSVERQVRYGVIILPDTPLPIPDPPQPTIKMTYQEQKELQLKNKREEMHKKIQYLNDQLRGDREHTKEKPHLNVQVKQILSKEEHEQKVKQMQGEWAQTKKRHEQAVQEAARKRKQMQERQNELRILQQQKKTERKRQAIEENIKKRRAEHQKLLQIQKQMQKKFQSLKGKERLYHKMQTKYQSEVMLPSLEEKKNKLKQLREFHKNYGLEAIRQHEKKYLIMQEKQRQKQRMKQKLKEQVKQKNGQEQQTDVNAYKAPQRSQKLNRILAQEAEAVKMQLNAKKLQNQEMQRRLEQFEKQILSKHRPRIDQSKKQQILQRYNAEEKKHQRLSVDIDIKRVGDSYMEMAKKMRRSQSNRRDVKTDRDRHTDEPKATVDQNSLLLSRAKNRSQDFYEGIRRRRIEDIINSEDNSSRQKFHMLKQQTDKIGEKIRQKEELARIGKDDQAQQQAAELLLSSIKAKMGIMNVLSNRPQKPGSAQTEE